MPEKELIVYLPAASADLAIRDAEFHQIILIVVLIGAVATIFFAIFLLATQEMDLLEKRLGCTRREDFFVSVVPISRAYHQIRSRVKSGHSLLASKGESSSLSKGKRRALFTVSGAINTFKTEAEAKQAFLQQAKRRV